jgi:hypothetical protein
VDEFWMVMALACMPALGNFAGGLAAEFVPTGPRALNRALRAAAGVLLAIVAVEIMPEALARCRLGRWRSLSCSVAAFPARWRRLPADRAGPGRRPGQDGETMMQEGQHDRHARVDIHEATTTAEEQFA